MRKEWTKVDTNGSTDVTKLMEFLTNETNALERFYRWEEKPKELPKLQTNKGTKQPSRLKFHWRRPVQLHQLHQLYIHLFKKKRRHLNVSPAGRM